MSGGQVLDVDRAWGVVLSKMGEKANILWDGKVHMCECITVRAVLLRISVGCIRDAQLVTDDT